MKLIDLTGQRFGKLVVVKRGEDYISPKGHRAVRWICKCDCGNEVLVAGHSLKNNATLSCGCYNKESTIKRNQIEKKKDFNRYEIIDNYVKIYSETKTDYCLIDLEDLNRVKNYHWHTNGSNYWEAWLPQYKKLCRMHRFLLNKENDKTCVIDHINGDINDNRKNNLRLVSIQQNAFNHKVRKNSTSGVTGVSYDKIKNKWMAYIGYNKKNIFLGYFDNKEEAIETRKEAERKYFKEYARKI